LYVIVDFSMTYSTSDSELQYIMCINHTQYIIFWIHFFYELKSGDQIICLSMFVVNIDKFRPCAKLKYQNKQNSSITSINLVVNNISM
jgi:hypothetical protein